MPLASSSPGVLFLRFVLLVIVILVATWGAHEIRDALDLQIRPDNEQQVHRAITLGSVAYIALLPLPFVPGADIGIAILAAFEPGIAPLIHIATVAAMMLAFTIGCFILIGTLQRLLSALRMRRVAKIVARAAPLSGDERLAMFLDGQSKRAIGLGLRYRYIALARAVNTPGNSFIGGGGGIMMIAGLSGLFTPTATFLTVAIAVSPVPLTMIFFGLRF